METNHMIMVALFLFCYTSHSQSLTDTVVARDKTTAAPSTEVRYFYFPNLQAYFDTKKGFYIYNENGTWLNSERLPVNYRGYSRNNGLYVLIKGYLGEKPYSFLGQHKLKYPANYSSRRQLKPMASTD